MKCSNCGRKNSDNTMICSGCGMRLVPIRFEKPDKIKVGASTFILLILYVLMFLALNSLLSQFEVREDKGDTSVEQMMNDNDIDEIEKDILHDLEEE